MGYREIRDAIKRHGGDLSRKDRQVLIGMLAEDFEAMFPAVDRRQGDHAEEITAEWRDWAAKSPIISGLPEDYRHVSWLLWRHAGFEPVVSKKAWMSAITELLEAAGGDVEMVKQAIVEGQRARVSGGVVLKGPRSFVGFARNLRSKQVLEESPVQLELIDLDNEERGGVAGGEIKV